MNRVIMVALIAVFCASTSVASERAPITGDYVEARTAEVFTGGCIMGSEAESTGREAVMAWRIHRGSFNNVALDGLTMIAAVAADRNLGVAELGGVGPRVVRAVLLVDSRASAAQRDAMTLLARDLTKGVIHEIVDVQSAPIEFTRSATGTSVRSSIAELDVLVDEGKHVGCGAMKWFGPLSAVREPMVGIAQSHSFSGSGLDIRWSDPGKRSAYLGTFTY